MAKKKRDALIGGVDFELDFDLDDFDIDVEIEPAATRIIKPRMDVRSVSHRLTYRHAAELAEDIDLQKGARTFLWVDGSFYFGDLLEALVQKRHIGLKKLYISTLSLNQENVDSIKNLLMFTKVERVVLLLSGFFYSHYKFDLVPYMYHELDIDDRVQIAFCNTHCKIITFETSLGNYYTMHGSANLRSSNSLEQLMVEEGEELYRFNADIMESIASAYGTIDHSVKRDVRDAESWAAVLEAVQEREGKKKRRKAPTKEERV